MLTPSRIAAAVQDAHERDEIEKTAAEVSRLIDRMELDLDRARALLRCLRLGLAAD